MSASDFSELYERYLARCNEHRFDTLGEFVAAGVVVNGEPQGLAGYIAGLQQVVEHYPDYRWNLQHLLVEGDWLAAHFLDTGHMRPRRSVSAQEFAFYRVAGGLIVEVWVGGGVPVPSHQSGLPGRSGGGTA